MYQLKQHQVKYRVMQLQQMFTPRQAQRTLYTGFDHHQSHTSLLTLQVVGYHEVQPVKEWDTGIFELTILDEKSFCVQDGFFRCSFVCISGQLNHSSIGVS